MKKERILYFYLKTTTFVQRDINMLRDNFELKNFSFYHSSIYFTPILFIQELIFAIKNIYRAKAVFCMFAGYHSLIPAVVCKIFNKPFFIILGGTESVVIPSIGYGILRKPLLRNFARWSYTMTDHFVPVHKSLIESQNKYSDIVPPEQGIKNHFHGLKISYTEIPNGFDSDRFRIIDTERKENSFITVAFDLHKPHLYTLKGIDLVVNGARALPEFEFTIIGLETSSDLPPNVHSIKAMPQEELIHFYNKHQYYLQLSLTEGFPNALCEAMLCGCVPIVSDVAAMPEIVEGVGYILKKRDEGGFIKLIKMLASKNTIKPSMVRNKIVQNYPLEKRRRLFLRLIKNAGN